MPKLKSNRGAAKRFRATAKGGFKCRSVNRNHILTKKTTKRKRHLRAGLRVRDEDLGRVKQKAIMAQEAVCFVLQNKRLLKRLNMLFVIAVREKENFVYFGLHV